MKRFSMWLVAGALLLHAPAWAGGAGSVSSLALPKVVLDPADEMAFGVTPAVPSAPDIAPDAVTPEAPALAMRSGIILESVQWRPRRQPRPWRDPDRWQSSSHRSSGFSQVHAGSFDLDGDQGAGFLAGFRGGATVDDHIQLGVGIDWAYKSDRQTVLVSSVPLPGGGTSERRLELARSSSNLIPIMALLQVSPGNEGDLHPYFGVAGGYEVLVLSAEDFTTRDAFDATYGGWGWQAWAGLAIPLSGHSNLNAEIFRNTADVERDVKDDASGVTYREIVNQDGVGLRFGLSWGF